MSFSLCDACATSPRTTISQGKNFYLHDLDQLLDYKDDVGGNTK